MNEAEWLACTDPQRLLTYLQLAGTAPDPNGNPMPNAVSIISDRKLRLFACACRRQHGGRYCWDGNSSGWQHMEDHPEEEILANNVGPPVIPAMEHALIFVDGQIATKLPPGVGAALLRDIVGNPFQPVTMLAEQWDIVSTSTARAVARAAYDNRDFGALPVLADALEDAGCDNEDILRHCRGEERCPVMPVYVPDNGHTVFCDCKGTGWIPLRGPGPHVRGCWVLDLLLGKERR